MHASSIEYLHAIAVLGEADIIGSDARTSLQCINQRTPDITYQQILADIKAIAGTPEDTHRIIGERYGRDALRAVCALRERA